MRPRADQGRDVDTRAQGHATENRSGEGIFVQICSPRRWPQAPASGLQSLQYLALGMPASNPSLQPRVLAPSCVALPGAGARRHAVWKLLAGRRANSIEGKVYSQLSLGKCVCVRVCVCVCVCVNACLPPTCGRAHIVVGQACVPIRVCRCEALAATTMRLRIVRLEAPVVVCVPLELEVATSTSKAKRPTSSEGFARYGWCLVPFLFQVNTGWEVEGADTSMEDIHHPAHVLQSMPQSVVGTRFDAHVPR